VPALVDEATFRKAAETSKMQRGLATSAFVLGAAALVTWAMLGDIPLLPW
jgi:hypothetical protein